MTMSSTLIDSIKRRAADEAQRVGYPAGFPVLPPVPAGRYGDEAFAELEVNAVFGRSWLMVAHTDQLPEPGSYLKLGPEIAWAPTRFLEVSLGGHYFVAGRSMVALPPGPVRRSP